MPDKAITRFAHEAHHHKGGGETAFKLMKTLRGQLMKADVADDPNVWAVASLNDDRYTVIVFNDHYEDKNIEIKIDAPPGFSLDGGTLALGKDIPDTGMILQEEDLPYSDKNSSYFHKIRVGGKDAVRYHFGLKKEAEASIPTHKIIQFAAPEILQQVLPDQPADFHVEVPLNALPPQTTAKLRFVHDSNLRWRPEDLSISVNGKDLAVSVNTDYLHEVPLPLSMLTEKNVITFHAAAGSKGFLLCTASIFLETTIE
jgi:hypothetical protein